MNSMMLEFDAPWSDITEIRLPKGAQIIAFDEQFEAPRMWAIVDQDEKETELRIFRIVGLRQDLGFPPGNLSYIGTAKFAAGRLVFHLFEIIGIHTDDLVIPEGMQISRAGEVEVERGEE